EGVLELRRALAEKIATFNEIIIDPESVPLQLLITPGATAALIAIAQTYFRSASALVFEPYYPYHRHILNELGGTTEALSLHGEKLELDRDELRARCRELKNRNAYPLRAIILCTPANPTGKVFHQRELESIAAVCQEFDLLCVADEVYEHYVIGDQPHISMATLPGMWERTITVNSFSKSWNISGWRLGYVYGDASLVSPINKANNVFYVCSPTPLQRALSEVLMMNPLYYTHLRETFAAKRTFAVQALEQVGFEIYDSGSSFYVWARIPEGFEDAMQLNETLIDRAQVAGVPGSAFAESNEWNNYMRLCIAREDEVLQTALDRLKSALMQSSS
ncbi:MAG TPA: aminotransferase class I/II-fold pyridoxal phosphate-dependent enzyme, partial [Pyrinomonadaceae bacterium]|nr:aminotransferase class I/II-fold pyridoxal phosphate-dependent enzyme [Pyrinomonadaceae bacterium]